MGMQELTPSSPPSIAADELPEDPGSGPPCGSVAMAPGVLTDLAGEWNSPAHAELEARRLFHRTLSAWAMDVLALRRRGLDTPRCLTRSMGLVTPRRAA